VDYFYSAAMHRSRGVPCPSFSLALIPPLQHPWRHGSRPPVQITALTEQTEAIRVFLLKGNVYSNRAVRFERAIEMKRFEYLYAGRYGRQRLRRHAVPIFLLLCSLLVMALLIAVSIHQASRC
jgi:hypothetical protein